MMYEAHWDPEAFAKMGNLSSLKVLVWWGYPLNALPLGVQLDELVHLQMINSKVKRLWNGNESFGKLKVIDLSNSKGLRQTLNISGIPNLEELYLNDCTKLIEVCQSIRQHKKLMVVSLMGCVDLKTFPSVTALNLMNCKSLLYLPNSISNLKSLRILNISGCSKICTLPNGINRNKALKDIDLSRTAIRELDPSLFQLENIKRLSFSGCSRPTSNFSWEFRLPFSKKFRFFPSQTGLTLPPFVSALSSLTELDLSYYNLIDNSIPHCPQLQSLPMLPPHVRLYVIDSDAREANALDPQKIWKVFESSEKEFLQSSVYRMFDFFDPMHFEIPSRFDNQNFFPLSSSYVSKLDSIASVTVDIPDDCLSSDWWGVAVFVALEAEVPQDSEEASKETPKRPPEFHA
ncbi:hypothetical protein TSUD_147510 [Trifolium subterraneum]|uniref:Uncharacterized protein n=1 Tax=Trifolium subterraneum TaxID=3900 RepID=A0A2Z6N8D7_TRISU|nr:hypothetical protein TSUD_147510 [Trifolium subterraneum]